MKTLLILNDPPYGTERSYNALRLASSLSKQPDAHVRVFLIGEGATCAHAHQKVPQWSAWAAKRRLQSLGSQTFWTSTQFWSRRELHRRLLDAGTPRRSYSWRHLLSAARRTRSAHGAL